MDILAAKDAIRKKLYAYCRSVDRLDKELGYSVFAEDGTADYGSTYNGPARGVIDLILLQHSHCKYTSHQISNVTIKVDGDRAASEAYCTAAVEVAAPDGKLFLTIPRVRYNDLWACREGDWVIVKRVVSGDITYTTTIEKEIPQYNTSRGDQSDASFGILY